MSVVTLDEARAAARVDGSADDALLQRLIAAAEDYAARRLGLDRVPEVGAELVEVVRPLPVEERRYLVALRWWPAAVLAVQHPDTDEALPVQAAPRSRGAEIVGAYLPPRVLVRYRAAPAPSALWLVVVQLVAHWYANREAARAQAVATVPLAAEHLLRQMTARDAVPLR